MTMRNAFGELATDATISEGMTLLRRMLALLKPLGTVTGNQSNRLSVDINTLPTVNAVNTVATVTNQANMGGVSAFELMKAMSRTGYNTGPRSNIT
jgi:hypothetical protein